MKKNKYIFLIAFILLVIAVVLILSKSSGTFDKKLKDFAIEDTASVTKIFLADKSNRSVLFEKESQGNWKLNGKYPARQSGIDLLLETMMKLVPRYPVPKKAHNNIVSLLATRSVKVEIYQEAYRINLFNRVKLFQYEKLTRTYYVGGASPDNIGTYMLMEGASVPFVVHLLGFRGFVAPRFSTLEKDWRDHTVFNTRLSEIQSVIMEFPNKKDDSYEINVNEEYVVLKKLYNKEIVVGYDTLKLLNFLTSFANIKYESLLENINPERKDSIISSTPQHILTVVDTKGDSTTIKTFFKPNDERTFDTEGRFYTYDVDKLYALINEDRDFVIIQYFVFDKVLRPLSYFDRKN